MSTKGTKLLPETREKIALAKSKITIQHLRESADTYHSVLFMNDKQLPTIQAYCLVAGISPSYLYQLAQENPEVEDIIDMILVKQEKYLLENGITGRANPIFSMFLLKSKHNYQDSPKQLTQNNNFNISPDILADAIKLMRAKDKE
jgi:hypothetical protein